VTIPQRVHPYTLTCLVTAESSTHKVTAALAPLPIWLSSLRPLVVSYGDDAAALFAAASRLVCRLEDSCHVEPGEAAIAYSLAELASDMCPSETTHGRLVIHLHPPPPGSPSFHLAFECRILVRDSEQTRSWDEKKLPTAAAACWTDTAPSTHSRPQQCRATVTSTRLPRHNHQPTREACADSPVELSERQTASTT
jgi:hypothetical protein